MLKSVVITLFLSQVLSAAEGNPILRWLVNPEAATTTDPKLRAILPNVQNVKLDHHQVVVESAGLSLESLGALQANQHEPSLGVRKFVYRFPLQPKPAGAAHTRTPVEIVGAFLNGVPIYTVVSPASYRAQNLWHRDATAASQSPRTPLLDSLLTSTTRHSPLIGFALDGFPIYGPYGWASDGTVRSFRSSYRLRHITRRTSLPDGTELTPSQEGPPPSEQFPLGTFVEDYEYAPGSGDLDECNGRFTRTPEYPRGTYAYFLSTDSQHQMTYPYLVGPSYFGEIDATPPQMPVVTQHAGRVDFTTPEVPKAGDQTTLIFTFRDSNNRRIRFLERVHEQPIHLLIVSTDLAEFAHIHPTLQSDDSFAVDHIFAHGGKYWLYVDHTPPGSAQIISRFSIDVKGPARGAEEMQPDKILSKTVDGIPVKLTLPSRPRAGQDITFRFDVPDGLEPYLGAWAHIMIISRDRGNFIHAHPVEEVVDTDPWQHKHIAPGPSPSFITTVTGFRGPGLYRLWVQFQRQGKVFTVPYTFKVDAAELNRVSPLAVPLGAILVRVSDAGFNPARINVPAGKTVTLAFHRDDAQNCASAVVFPALNISKSLPPGQTVLVELPASAAREYYFTCGMNMHRGSIVIR